MRIIVLGEKGLLSSRLIDFFSEQKNVDLKSISLRNSNLLQRFLKGEFGDIFLNQDCIINAIGPNNIQCTLNNQIAQTFYIDLPIQLIKYANENKIKYIQFSSVHSVNYQLSEKKIVLPNNIKPNNSYSKYHNLLEKNFLSGINFNKYATVIRLCNSIGPPSTNNYHESHWLSICNKFAYQLLVGEKIILKDPNIYKSFLPISSILKNLYIQIRSKERRSINQFLSNYQIKLKDLAEFMAMFIHKRKKTKKENLNYFKKIVFKDNSYSDIVKNNIDEYYDEFVFEIEKTFQILKNFS